MVERAPEGLAENWQRIAEGKAPKKIAPLE
jgi:hypothetical protein